MNFLNLSLGELLGLAGAVSAGLVALYLLDRSKRKLVVSTLRFWSNAGVRTELKHRRRIQQPWSLALQLIGILLLLAAIAGPRFGVIDSSGLDHVVLLDTSAWMGSRTRQGVLLDDAKAAVRAYVQSLPARDRVMLVRAGALATPATGFESNRQALDTAIAASQPDGSALSLSRAIEFAVNTQRQQSRRAGEIVYAGAGRVAEEEASFDPAVARLRVIAIGSPQENIGFRKVGLRRSPLAPDAWDIFVAVRNYGALPHDVDVELQFAKSPAGSRHFALAPRSEATASFVYRAKSAGYLEARLNVKDAFPQDDRVLIELPSQASLKVVVYSNQPQLLRPLFASNPQVEAEFLPTARFDAAGKADLVVLDRFAPPSLPRANSLWIQPPAHGSPFGVHSASGLVKLDRWRPETALGAGLRGNDVFLYPAETFIHAAGDITVAESAQGPVVVARGDESGGTKMVALGFHPGLAPMKYALVTPLLMANLLRWMSPGVFRRWDVQAGAVGNVAVPVEKGTPPESVHVTDESNRPLPFTIEGTTLQFFSGSQGTVRVQIGDHETDYSLTLPDVAEAQWRPPANVMRGVPRAPAAGAGPTDIWPWLAILGGLCLLADWLLFGRSRAFRIGTARVSTPVAENMSHRKAS